MAACDVCVSLRAPTMGETSGSAMRALSLGRPLVVSDLGWFAELPDGVARKVPVGEGEVDALVAALQDPPPASHVPAEHRLDHVADLYAAALEQAAGGEAVREAVLREVARAGADVGISEEVTELGSRLREVGLGE